MRLLQIAVPEDQRETIVDALRDRQLGFVVLDEGGEDGKVLIQFVSPADAVEHVLNDLVEAGYDREGYTVSLDAEFASFRNVDEVQNRWAKTPNKIAPATLRSKAKDMRRNTRSYLWMMVFSAVVATAGLLLSSPAVVVGAMVIAPIVSPALTASVGTVRNDQEMVVDSIHQQALGLGVAIVIATLFSLLVKETHVVPQTLAIEQMELMSLRLSPSVLGAVVALFAGAAGAYGLATKGQVTIVGVMIAAALIPTAAAVGIGLAWVNTLVAVGALVLLVLNIIAVNIGGTAALFYLGYRPDQVDESLLTFEDATETLVVGGTILLVVATVVATGGVFYSQSSFERAVNEAVTDVLNGDEYSGLDVSSITVEQATPVVIANDTTVTITLARTSDQAFPDLPNRLDRRITEETGRDVVVQLQFVDYERSNVSRSSVRPSQSDAERGPRAGDAVAQGLLGRPAAPTALR